jgi:myosin-18
VFFRKGTLGLLESRKEHRSESRLIGFQAHCRGYLARKGIKSGQAKHVAIRCVQKNIRKYLVYQKWSWWKLYAKIIPLLDVHRMEEELKELQVEVEELRGKASRLEQENKELKDNEIVMTEEVIS